MPPPVGSESPHPASVRQFWSPPLPPPSRSYHSQNTRQEFAEAFRAIDANKDGTIDIGELQRLMAATGCALAEQELQEIFGALDKDGNGNVDLEEFVDKMVSA